MSQGRYIKIKLKIFTDSKEASRILTMISESFHQFRYFDGFCEASWDQFHEEKQSDFTEIEAMVNGIMSGAPTGWTYDLLKPIDTLENGSFAIMVCDSDFGVNGEYYCFGSAKFKKIEFPSIDSGEWSCEDIFQIAVSMKKKHWAQLLSYEGDNVCEYIEELNEGLLAKVFDSEMVDFLKKFGDTEIMETWENTSAIDVIIDTLLHEFSIHSLKMFKEKLYENIKKLSRYHAKIKVYFVNAERENDIYQNEMIDPDNYSVLKFATGENFFDEPTAYVAKF